MHKFLATLSALAAGATVSAIPATAAPGDIMLSAKLTGAAETPAGSPDGTGTFLGRLNSNTGQLCYTLTSQKLSAITAAHIHVGGAGVEGQPVVVLTPAAPSETCMAVDKATADKIAAKPGDYYVNIHNTTYPDGAIRGQLMMQ